MRTFFTFALLALLPLGLLRAEESEFPEPTNRGDASRMGKDIQRTMTLLATSTPEQKNTVTILLYGQSITAGKWGIYLEEHLRETYPDANLIYVRKPLSGFASHLLSKTSEFDMYPVYPDLVIFHDLGNDKDYETMIRNLRERTTAEVIIQADHLRRNQKVIDESDPAKVKDRSQQISAFRNYRFLPEVARKYGCAFDARRDLWKDYLREHNLEPGVMVADHVHPNEHGTYLMTELIKAYLVKREDVKIDPMNCGYVTTIPVTEDMRTDDGALQYQFDGNRIDVIFSKDATQACAAQIDGAQPLDIPAMRYHGRNRVKWRGTPIPPGPWPAVLKVGFEQPLIDESWTLTATQDQADPKLYLFEVRGSKTGADGSGRTDQRFVSNSGRVVIEPDDWEIKFAITDLRRLKELPSEFELNWTVMKQATNDVTPPKAKKGVERAVTVAQLLTDEKHTLILTGGIEGVRALRIYSPSKFPCPANGN
ncbi:SGNH/GDSL hydrolase family protein [Stratiformator vulcanicus]|uniref:SGNH hydrolase-type esterase domain-containing protein n=1 Tax=Stratiformator vulcanicus TaxID=2527980 RepID=A0A517QXB3_9PLAN|nr:SGNH/GDSL hydrolase family protein [Stratiformator vulcanicus]QDT36237.1 hypothetical protein Pan189_05920 [Stratiformator vulcanicus]